MKIAEVGQRVQWASQAGGWWKAKEGEVIYAEEADSSGYTRISIDSLPKEFIEAPKSRRVSGSLSTWLGVGWIGSSGLVVRVDTINGKPTSRPLYYSPARTFRIEVVS